MSSELTRDGSSEDDSDGDQPHHKRTHHVGTPVDPVDGDDEEEGGGGGEEEEEGAAARASGTTASSSLSTFMPPCTLVLEDQCTDV